MNGCWENNSKSSPNRSLNFDLEVTGFETAEIDVLIDGLETINEPDPDDRLPAIESSAVSATGDLWQLGKHRVLCGNSLILENYDRLMDGAKADLCNYRSTLQRSNRRSCQRSGRARHREFQMASGEMTRWGIHRVPGQSNGAIDAKQPTGFARLLLHGLEAFREILAAGLVAYGEPMNLCVWAKNNAGMGSFYRSAHELILLFKNGETSHRNNIQLGRYGRYRTNVWNYPSANTFSRSGPEGDLLALHPTPKPVALIADAIKDSTRRGALVLDPFLGSGTAVIAAERAGESATAWNSIQFIWTQSFADGSAVPNSMPSTLSQERASESERHARQVRVHQL